MKNELLRKWFSVPILVILGAMLGSGMVMIVIR